MHRRHGKLSNHDPHYSRLVSQDHGAPEMFYSDSMRYEPSDMQVFVQLIVFSAMAAFTDAFDITNGIASDPTQGQINNLLSYGGFNKGDVSAQMFRNNRLPVLNARGISMSMGLSRMVLLIQYLAGTFCLSLIVIFISLVAQYCTMQRNITCRAPHYGPIYCPLSFQQLASLPPSLSFSSAETMAHQRL